MASNTDDLCGKSSSEPNIVAPQLRWSAAMSVGVDTLDQDHQVIFRSIIKCQTFIEKGEDFRVLHELLTELYEYTDYHFKREEAFMEASGYPQLKPHKKEHEDIAIRVEEFLSDMAVNGGLTTAKQLLDFLTNWWHAHILEMDQKYRPWVEKALSEENPF